MTRNAQLKERVEKAIKENKVNEPGKNGQSLLHWVIQQDYCPEIVTQLVRAGANMNSKDNYGSTPLHVAAQTGDKDSTESLISHGAGLDHQNNRNDTPLHNSIQGIVYLCDDTWSVGKRYFIDEKSMEIANQLIKSGARVDLQNNEGKTALHQVIDIKKSFKMIDNETFLRNSDTDRKSIINKLIKDNYRMIKNIVSNMPKIGFLLQDENGYTPLHSAVKGNRETVAKLLLREGSKEALMIKDKNGYTPLELARHRGNKRIIDLLEKAEGMHKLQRWAAQRQNQPKLQKNVRVMTR